MRAARTPGKKSYGSRPTRLPGALGGGGAHWSTGHLSSKVLVLLRAGCELPGG